MSKPDSNGNVNYKDFSLLCRDYINELFSMKSLAEKSQLIAMGTYKVPADLENINLTKLDLFKLFKKYDRNQNGFLEIYEYIQCLRESNLDLADHEIITLGLNADINADGRIDYEEFMKHFQDCLKIVRFHNNLQNAYNEYKEIQNQGSPQKA